MLEDQVVEDDFVLVGSNDASRSSSDLSYQTPSNHDNQQSQSRYLDRISSIIDGLSSTLRPINLAIHDDPELGYKEYHAHKVLTEFLSSQPGWVVTPHAYGIETAFIAVYDTGREGPVVSFNAEYDALPGIGHACGHNLIAMASLSGALATKVVMEEDKLSGKVVLFGTPAEEGGGGKIALLNAGAYSDHNVCVNLISHPGIVSDSALTSTSAYTSFHASYYGRAAHAAAAPWEGINALDALITAFTSISLLRQQTQPGDIIQGNITNGGLKPNIIHAFASGQFVVRSTTRARRDRLLSRVLKCFEAAATSTGARLRVESSGAYADHRPNWTLGARYRSHFNALGGAIPAPEVDFAAGASAASTDQGDVSYAVPSISPGFWVRSEGADGTQLGGPHTPDFAGAARKLEAHRRALMVGKGLAATAVDVLTVEGLLGEIRREFEDMKEKADEAERGRWRER